jgi:hypothetical protein
MHLTRKVEGVGHKLSMDNYFSSMQLFSAPCNRKMNSFGTVCQNRQGMPANFEPKTLKLKKGEVCKVKGGTRAVLVRQDRDLTPHQRAQPPSPPPPQVILCSKKEMHQNLCPFSYNKSVGFVDLSNMTAISYSISCKSRKWPKKHYLTELS